jgi:hypothetical protein
MNPSVYNFRYVCVSELFVFADFAVKSRKKSRRYTLEAFYSDLSAALFIPAQRYNGSG